MQLAGCCIFVFTDTATTEIYPLPLHDALPISTRRRRPPRRTPDPRGQDGTVHRQESRLTDLSSFLTASPTPYHAVAEDRKSTRLNSSHANMSYAVFCLHKTIGRRIIPPEVIDG